LTATQRDDFALKAASRKCAPQCARLPLPRANGRCGFSEGTFTRTRGDDRDAPNAVIPRAATSAWNGPKQAV